MADYLVGTGLIRGLHQNSSLDKVVLASSVASIERQTSLGGPGLITSVNRKKDLPGWACPNQWCESKYRLACIGLSKSLLSIKKQISLGEPGLISGVN